MWAGKPAHFFAYWREIGLESDYRRDSLVTKMDLQSGIPFVVQLKAFYS
jgi:hypothetical protein